jgi:enoyl-CoA hydratase/carnithine racemase
MRDDQRMIDVEYHDRIAVVSLRHGKVNALDLELLQAISGTFRGLDADAVVLTGVGRAFSAGIDLKKILECGAKYTQAFLPVLSETLLTVFDHPRPVVAAINGHAFAEGCVLAAACDIRLMSAGTIGLPELRVGVPFPVAALEIIVSAIGPAAHTLALTGLVVDVDTAISVGLAHQKTNPESLIKEAIGYAADLAAINSEVYAFTKQQLHRPVRKRIEVRSPIDDAEILRRWSQMGADGQIATYLASLANRT